MRGLSVFTAWRRHLSPRAARKIPRPSFCPRLEVLEDRTVLSPTVFTGGDSANPQAWNDALNWTAGIPTASSDAVIGSGFTVSLSSNSSINSLTVSGAFNLSGANLVLNAGTAINATGGLALTGNANLDAPGGVSNAGTVSIATGCNLIVGASTLPTSGLAGWWTGDGTANDSAGGNNGTLQNGATYAAGEVGQGFSFNGTNAYFRAPYTISGNTPTTISLWINPSALQRSTIFKIGDKRSMEWDPLTSTTGSVHFGTTTSSETSANQLIPVVANNVPLNSWTYVVATWDGTTGSVYLNGVLQASSSTATGNENPMFSDTSLGAGISGIGFFPGLIDEFQIYNRVLSSTEVQADMAARPYAQTSGTTLEGGTLTANGGVNLEGGSLAGRGTISGSLFNSSQLDGRGTPGALAVTGDFTQSGNGVFDAEIGGTTPGTGYDQLNVNGTANLAGTLNVSLINGFVPPSSVRSYQILTFATRTGDFTSKNGLLPNFVSSYDQFTLTLQSPAVPITTMTLANWNLNQAGYSQTLMATGGSGALTFSKTAGTLPIGLNLSSSGVLSGTPVAAGSFSFIVTVTDSMGATGSQSYTVVILVNSTFSVETFAGNGLWRHSDITGWQQLTPADASNIAVDDHGNVAAVFFNGLWRYEDVGGWQRLTPAVPSQVDIAGNGIVAAAFPGNGLWRYGDPAVAGGGWQQLTLADPQSFGIDDQGDTVIAIPGNGTYLYQDGSGWQLLSPAVATQVSIAASGISVAAAFQGVGVWRYNFQGTAVVPAGWQQLTPAIAQALVIGPTGAVGCAFNNGVWLYQDNGGWTYLTPALSSLLSITNATEVVAEFSGNGVWEYSSGWQQLTPADAKLVRGARD
jgi:hypothetical protein